MNKKKLIAFFDLLKAKKLVSVPARRVYEKPKSDD
jgi:hypothetical protein